MKKLAAGTLRQKFEDAVNRNDFRSFNSDYQDYLSQFPAFVESSSTTPADLAVHNPIFGETSFYLKQTTDSAAQKLLADGRAASGVFGALTVAERLDFLRALQEKVRQHADDIGLVIAADTGKPVDLAVKEMAKGDEWFDYAYKTAEEQLGPKDAASGRSFTRPRGVAQVIGAYNYPYALAIGGVVGALAAGNGVIVSAPLKAPDWVFPFMEAVQEAVDEFGAKAAAEGKPWAADFSAAADGLVQYSVGVNRSLTAEADIVHFVGGDVTGNIISKSRGLKKTILEMGGSNVVAVMDSALDHDGAAQEIAQALYNGFAPATGQRCTAPRIFCVATGAEDVVAALGKIVAEGDHKTGNPFTAGTKIGPLVDRGAFQKMEEAIALAEELGAKVYGSLKVNSNCVPQALNAGAIWVGPVVIDWSPVDRGNPDAAARLTKLLGEEIFGPLLHVVHRVNGVEEAIAVANRYDTHGLSGGIFAGRAEECEKYAAGVNVTSLTFNEGPKDRSPWGPHGHPGLDVVGGRHHFNLYASESVVVQQKPKAKPAPSASSAAMAP